MTRAKDFFNRSLPNLTIKYSCRPKVWEILFWVSFAVFSVLVIASVQIAFFTKALFIGMFIAGGVIGKGYVGRSLKNLRMWHICTALLLSFFICIRAVIWFYVMYSNPTSNSKTRVHDIIITAYNSLHLPAVLKNILLGSIGFLLIVLAAFSCTVLVLYIINNFSLKSRNWRYGILLAFFVLSVYYVIIYSQNVGYNEGFFDYKGQRMLVAYTMNGYNPFPYVGQEFSASEYFTLIPKDFSTSPWGLFMGNFFYPSFLYKYGDVARPYFITLNILSLIAVFWVTVKKYGDKLGKFSIALLFVFVFFSPPFWRSLYYGNIGGMLGCFLILALYYSKEKPWLSGILLGFAMIKPQVALIICIVFLLNKRIIPLLIAAGMVIGSWWAASSLTNTGMIQLMKDFLGVGTGDNDGKFFGLFTPFLDMIGNNFLCLALSMVVSTVFVVVMHFVIVKRNRHDIDGKDGIQMLVDYSCAFTAAVYWSYGFDCDFFVLLLPMIVLLVMMNTVKMSRWCQMGVMTSIFLLNFYYDAVQTICFFTGMETKFLRGRVYPMEGVKAVYAGILLVLSVFIVVLYRRAKPDISPLVKKAS